MDASTLHPECTLGRQTPVCRQLGHEAAFRADQGLRTRHGHRRLGNVVLSASLSGGRQWPTTVCCGHLSQMDTPPGAKVYLTDLASKNFTFLNGKRIEPEGRFEFDAADTIEIGPFEIRCNVVHAADATEEPNVDEQTAFSADFVNPFLDGAGRFAAVLNEIEQQYGSESPTRRRDALEKALQAAMEGQGDHETRAVVADVLGRLLKSDSGKPKWTACEPWWNQESISCALSGG